MFTKPTINYNKRNHYIWYHKYMMAIGDNDPTYPALNYICNRFELNMEQRYWIAFLFSTNYCAPTTYYIYNEFPDYENVDVRKLQSWWDKNKSKCLFQTDRAKVKNFNLFVKMFESYRQLVGVNQKSFWLGVAAGETTSKSYDMVYEMAGNIYYMGRFSLFLYLEAMHRLTNIPIYPTGLDLKNAESCRNGLCYALGLDYLVGTKLSKEEYDFLTEELAKLMIELSCNHGQEHNYWNVETSLCAYKKLYWNKRYLGYYIDRMQDEIKTMEDNVKEGVNWEVLWDFRKEYMKHHKWLGELNNWSGIRKERMGLPNMLCTSIPSPVTEPIFDGVKEVYE